MSGRGSEPFAALYDGHIGQVYGFFGYRLGSREDAEDLTQLTFERALRAWERFDPRQASTRTWLLVIARNLLVDHYRRNGSRRQETIEPEELDESALGIESPEEPGIGTSPELEAALWCLSQRDRELVALRYGADLSGPEIAALTGLSLANVQQVLSRSLRRLRDELDSGEEGSDKSPAGLQAGSGSRTSPR